LSDDALLEVTRQVERNRCRLESTDAPLVAELEARGLPGRLLARDAASLLSGLLRISPHEANRRVRHAHDLAARVAVTGEPLDPRLPATAAARAAGELSDWSTPSTPTAGSPTRPTRGGVAR
jgi:hypothetical protein